MRPKTLPAGAVPVLIGTSSAYLYDSFNFFYFFLTLICSLLIQIITNFINEIYDAKKGADTSERLGPVRQVASGNISAKMMGRAAIILIISVLILGIVLILRGGLPILTIGVISLIMTWAYTAGPYPLAYKGLGDIFVLIFFGLIAVSGTYYIQTMKISTVSILAGFPPGFLSMNILGVNNIRDTNTDSKVNKMTLAVRLGERNSKILYIILNFFAYVPILFIYFITKNICVLLPFLSIIYSYGLSKKILRSKNQELNSILEGTGKLLMIFGILMSLGFVLSKY